MKNFQKLRNDPQQQARHWQHYLCSNRSTITSITIQNSNKRTENINNNRNIGIIKQKQDNIMCTIASN